MTPKEINEILTIPNWAETTPIKINEAEFIYNLVKEKKLIKTLETGFGFARSAAHIIAASGREHIAIDPFQANYQHIGLENIKKLGFEDKLIFKADFSHNVLPELVKEGRNFDFIFIDGDHSFPGAFIDFYYTDILLDVNGFVAFHDTWMRSIRLIEKFIEKNCKNYKKLNIPIKTMVIFQKIDKTQRDGMSFNEFYTFRSYFKYNLIMWMTTGEKTLLKKIMINLKNWIKKIKK